MLTICRSFQVSPLIVSSGGYCPVATGMLWWASPLETKPQAPQIKIWNTIIIKIWNTTIITKAISCSWTTAKISIFQFQLIITQCQSTLNHLGVILDDKLNWKPQIEKLVTQLSKSCGMLFKLKHYTNISVLKYVYFALFHSCLTYSIFNWGRANKTTLLPLKSCENTWI